MKDKFITWKITKAQDDDGFEFYYTYDYKLVDFIDHEANQCVLPFMHFEALLNQSHSVLNILRTVRTRPRNPYELVEFIEKYCSRIMDTDT